LVVELKAVNSVAMSSGANEARCSSERSLDEEENVTGMANRSMRKIKGAHSRLNTSREVMTNCDRCRKKSSWLSVPFESKILPPRPWIPTLKTLPRDSSNATACGDRAISAGSTALQIHPQTYRSSHR
jgi:hypothetical protein